MAKRNLNGNAATATDTPQLEASTTSSPDSAAQPSPDPRPIKQQSRAIQARWATEQSTEEDLRAHFHSLPLERALALLAQMRRNCTTAGEIINSRINAPGEQRCATCNLSLAEFKKRGKPDWWLNRPYYDPQDRNIIHVAHYCSAACVSLENNKTQGVRGIADQGMTPDMNPKNHPRTHPAQAAVAAKE